MVMIHIPYMTLTPPQIFGNPTCLIELAVGKHFKRIMTTRKVELRGISIAECSGVASAIEHAMVYPF